jgi:hypothetical protein
MAGLPKGESKVRRVMVLVVVGTLLVAVMAGTVSAKTAPNGVGSTCAGRDVYPGQDLTAVADAAPAGTTFCIHDGNYTISSPIRVQDSDVFRGLYSDRTRPSVSTTQASHIFYTHGSHQATISGLVVSGAVGDNSCEPDCGRGIGGGGWNLTVDNVRATRNANQGIGGTGPGLLVKNSMLDNNGSQSFANDGGPVSTAGIKSVNSMTVLNSTIRDNYWSGVWCDIECEAFTVKNSTITGNGKAGIHMEISSGPAVFAGNRIQNNGVSGRSTRLGGILIVGSSNAETFVNTFGGNLQGAASVFNDARTPPVSNVDVHDNTLKRDALNGCSNVGVDCVHNRRR